LISRGEVRLQPGGNSRPIGVEERGKNPAVLTGPTARDSRAEVGDVGNDLDSDRAGHAENRGLPSHYEAAVAGVGSQLSCRVTHITGRKAAEVYGNPENHILS